MTSIDKPGIAYFRIGLRVGIVAIVCALTFRPRSSRPRRIYTIRQAQHGARRSLELHEFNRFGGICERTGMIVWLPSYPRSGNTYLRLMLSHVFGVSCHSLYDEEPLRIGPDGLDIAAAGAGDPYDVERLYAAARDSRRLHLLKTHDAPLDDGPAIYIHRDGRAAVVSYYHYIKDFIDPGVSIADVILGLVPFGSWSEHHDAWRPADRPNTLVIRFEDLIQDHKPALASIGRFLEREPKENFAPDWTHLQRTAPRFFRSGRNDENISELRGKDAALFWLMHGRTMVELGYVKSAPRATRATRELLLWQRERWRAVLVEEHRKKLDLVEADRAERGRVAERLQTQLLSIDADRKEKDLGIEKLVAEIESLNRLIREDRKAKDEVIARLSGDLAAVDADRRAKDAVIAKLLAENETLSAAHRERGALIERLAADLEEIRSRK